MAPCYTWRAPARWLLIRWLLSRQVGGEGGHLKSRSQFQLALPPGGQPPRAFASLRSPQEGGTPPSQPPFKSRPLCLQLRPTVYVWRRGRDLNPRQGFWPCDGLANRCLRPLGHLSTQQQETSTDTMLLPNNVRELTESPPSRMKMGISHASNRAR